MSNSSIIITTTDFIPGKEITQVLGVARGNTIKSKHIGKDFMAGLKSIIGGELTGYTEMITEARNQAMDRMIQEATQMGADAIINVRFTTSAVMAGAAEILAYGTAVKIN